MTVTQSEIAKRRRRTTAGKFAKEAEKPQREPEAVLDPAYTLRDIGGHNGREALREARAARRAQVERLLKDGLAPGMVAWVAPGYTRDGSLKWWVKDDETMTLRDGTVRTTDGWKAVEEELPIDVLIVTRAALAQREALAAHLRAREAS